jgi:hypothetical protein
MRCDLDGDELCYPDKQDFTWMQPMTNVSYVVWASTELHMYLTFTEGALN